MAQKFKVNKLLLSGNEITANSSNLFINGNELNADTGNFISRHSNAIFYTNGLVVTPQADVSELNGVRTQVTQQGFFLEETVDRIGIANTDINPDNRISREYILQDNSWDQATEQYIYSYCLATGTTGIFVTDFYQYGYNTNNYAQVTLRTSSQKGARFCVNGFPDQTFPFLIHAAVDNDLNVRGDNSNNVFYVDKTGIVSGYNFIARNGIFVLTGIVAGNNVTVQDNSNGTYTINASASSSNGGGAGITGLSITGSIYSSGENGTFNITGAGSTSILLNSSNNIIISGTVGAYTPSAWSNLTWGTTTIWNAEQNTAEDRKILALTGNTTLDIVGLYNGWAGVLKIIQSGENYVSGFRVDLPSGSKVMNSGLGTLSLTSGVSGAIDVVGFEYDGSHLLAIVGNHFN